MDGTSKEKALTNINGGEKVGCLLMPDDAIESKNRFVLELTQDWDFILNTEKTGIHYYDNNVNSLRLIGEGLEDGEGKIIEDNDGTRKIVADRDIELHKDSTKPYVVSQKLIYDKIGSNGIQKAGSLGVVFNEPVQLFTKEMAENGDIPPLVHEGHNPLTPKPSQIGDYENFLPELKVDFEKIDKDGNVLKDENGQPILVEGRYDLMSDIFPCNKTQNEMLEQISIKMDEIPFKFNLDPGTSGINRFRDYGLFYITPETSLSEGKWRLALSGVSDDAGNEMDKYTSKSFDIKPLFKIEKLTNSGIKVKFEEPFNKKNIGSDSLVLVVTKYGEVVNSVVLKDLKEGQQEAEVKFEKTIEGFEGEYSVNNIKYDAN